MKKRKKQEDYPVEEANSSDLARLIAAGWRPFERRNDILGLTRENKIGMTQKKFVKIVEF